MGFAGGLRGGGGGGVSAPYVATLTLEALFHVATRMPADTPDAILNKVLTEYLSVFRFKGYFLNVVCIYEHPTQN